MRRSQMVRNAITSEAELATALSKFSETCAATTVVPAVITLAASVASVWSLWGAPALHWVVVVLAVGVSAIFVLFSYSWHARSSQVFADRTAQWCQHPTTTLGGPQRPVESA